MHLQGPFKGNINQAQKDYNKAKPSQVRVFVEWVLQIILHFLILKRTLKYN